MGQQFFFRILNTQHLPAEWEKEYIGPIEEVLMIVWYNGVEEYI